MSVSSMPVARPRPVCVPARRPRRPLGPRPRVPAHGLAALTCVALALAATLAWPTVPLYDEYSWLVWGRELAHLPFAHHLPFRITGGASWKPLPVLITTCLAPFGRAAPALWLGFVRAVGLFGLWIAYRLGARLGADRRWRASGAWAGGLSVIAVALITGWSADMLGGTSEPLTVTAALLGVEWALEGRRLPALGAGVALTLMRPEAAVPLIAYAAWCVWHEPGVARRLGVAGAVALVPAAWVLPPWLADGTPLQAAHRAAQYHGNLGRATLPLLLTRADSLVAIPVLAAAAAAVALALWRRDRPVLGVALLPLVYLAVVELELRRGLPGLARFLVPAAAIVGVLAGAGVARVAALARGGTGSTVVALVLVLAGAPAMLPRFAGAVHAPRAAAAAETGHTSLLAAVRRAGGPRRMLPCASSSVAINWREAPQLAWMLGVPLSRVHQATRRPHSVRTPGLALFALRRPILGTNPAHVAPGLYRHRLWREGEWTAFSVTRGSMGSVRCVGR